MKGKPVRHQKNTMRLLIFPFLFLAFSFSASAEKGEGIVSPAIQVTSRSKDTQLSLFQGKFSVDYQFVRSELGTQIPANLQASCNGYLFTVPVDSSGNFQLDVTPGKYVFKLFASTDYQELYSDSIEIAPQECVHLSANFSYTSEMMIVDKPVIYLYSDKTSTFDLQLNPEGKLYFSYPIYSDNWHGTVGPTGEITIDKQHFPYLFWEAEQNFDHSIFAFEQSVTVQNALLMDYLELCLEKLAFNEREKTDFITYWLPRMHSYSAVDILWLQDTELFDQIKCDGFQMNNVYIVFRENKQKQTLKAMPQANLKPVKRAEQTLIEWGGTEIKHKQL